MRRWVKIVVIAVVLALAGCGSATSTAVPAAGGAFPVTLIHAFGTTTVPAAPKRVVALGLNDVAIAAALDAPLIGAARNFADTGPDLPYGKRLPPDVLVIDTNGQLKLESIASLRPDLILATANYQVTAALYADLSRLAPVVAFQKSLYGSSIQDDALYIGKALGNETGAQRLVDAAARSVDALKAELPGLAGKAYLFGQARGEVLPMVVDADNLSTRFMTSLGLKVPAGFVDAPASNKLAPGTVGISYEEVSRLDEADALFMTFAGSGDKSAFETNPLVARLAVLEDSRYQPLTLDQAVALQAPNVVAVDWLIAQLRPTLTKIGRA